MDNSRLKFRVWDKEENHMYYMPAAELYENLFLSADGVLCNVDETEYSDPIPTDDRYELSFSTGLYDCEGREVFEGDFLSYENYKLEMVWDDYSWLLISKPFDDGTFVGDSVSYFEVGGKLDGAKIIGNRFENPELLEMK